MSALPHYSRAGQGTPFVLVHGYFGGSAHWAAETGALSNHFDLIAVDLPGFGESHRLEPPQTIAGFAEAVLSVLSALKIGDFILLGHSMGGMIAQEVTHKAGKRVQKLILYGTGPLGVLPSRFEPIDTSRKRLKSDGVAATAKRISATWFRDGSDHPGHAAYAKIGAMASQEAALAGLNAMESWDGRGRLASIASPTQIIWGEHDRSYGFREQEQLWRTIPNCSLAVIPHSAHVAHMEQPKIFQSILEASLNLA